jgi:hypothetical protein
MNTTNEEKHAKVAVERGIKFADVGPKVIQINNRERKYIASRANISEFFCDAHKNK